MTTITNRNATKGFNNSRADTDEKSEDNLYSLQIYIWVLIIAGLLAVILCILMIVLFWKKHANSKKENEENLKSVEQPNDVNQNKATFDLPPGMVNLQSISTIGAQNNDGGDLNFETNKDDQMGEQQANNGNNSDDFNVEASKSHQSLYEVEERNTAKDDEDDIYGAGSSPKGQNKTTMGMTGPNDTLGNSDSSSDENEQTDIIEYGAGNMETHVEGEGIQIVDMAEGDGEIDVARHD